MFARHILSALALVLLSLSASLPALADPSYIIGKYREGHGDYKTGNGNSTGHKVVINSDSRTGYYCPDSTPNNCGKLDKIEFNKDGFDVRGFWYYGGRSGVFVWNFYEEKKFSGSFRFEIKYDDNGVIWFPNDGDWNGSFK